MPLPFYFIYFVRLIEVHKYSQPPKMTPHQRYADYPPAQEASYISYKVEEDKNPALRGLPLAIGAAM